jgi:hypothetical protein
MIWLSVKRNFFIVLDVVGAVVRGQPFKPLGLIRGAHVGAQCQLRQAHILDSPAPRCPPDNPVEKMVAVGGFEPPTKGL